jgi:hypothetical protein
VILANYLVLDDTTLTNAISKSSALSIEYALQHAVPVSAAALD